MAAGDNSRLAVQTEIRVFRSAESVGESGAPWRASTSFDLDQRAALRETTLLLQTVADELQETVGELMDDVMASISYSEDALLKSSKTEGDSCPQLLPGLPYDLALQCLIRVPFYFHGVLRGVCRAWRAVLTSSSHPNVFYLRASQGLCEQWLYVMLRDHKGLYQWRAFEVAQQKWRVLPSLPGHPIGAACSVVNFKVFLMGGLRGGIASKQVWIFDPLRCEWTLGPPMRVPREFPAAGTVEGKIYVFGGCWAGSHAWAEVYDPETNRWSVVQSGPKVRARWMHGSVVLGRRIYCFSDSGGIMFEPGLNLWEPITRTLEDGWKGKAAVVRNVLFSLNHWNDILGYDPRSDSWRALNLKDDGRKLPRLKCGPLLAGSDGRLYVVGQSKKESRRQSELVTAAIELGEVKEDHIGGRVIWSDTAPCDLLVASVIHCLPVGL